VYKSPFLNHPGHLQVYLFLLWLKNITKKTSIKTVHKLIQISDECKDLSEGIRYYMCTSHRVCPGCDHMVVVLTASLPV